MRNYYARQHRLLFSFIKSAVFPTCFGYVLRKLLLYIAVLLLFIFLFWSWINHKEKTRGKVVVLGTFGKFLIPCSVEVQSKYIAKSLFCLLELKPTLLLLYCKRESRSILNIRFSRRFHSFLSSKKASKILHFPLEIQTIKENKQKWNEQEISLFLIINADKTAITATNDNLEMLNNETFQGKIFNSSFNDSLRCLLLFRYKKNLWHSSNNLL